MLLRRPNALLAALGTLALVTTLRSQTPPPTAQTPAQAPAPATTAKPESEDGIPITNPTVKTVCGSCHVSDSQGRMSRISYRRTTPEGWQETIRRMATLNKAPIDPADARLIVKYLSDNLGLAPEEAKPGTFETERRLIDYTYAANKDTADVCSSCHSMGRVILQRRSEEDWDLLVAMHRGWYPLVDGQSLPPLRPARRRRQGPTAGRPTTGTRWTRRSRTSSRRFR